MASLEQAAAMAAAQAMNQGNVNSASRDPPSTSGEDLYQQRGTQYQAVEEQAPSTSRHQSHMQADVSDAAAATSSAPRSKRRPSSQHTWKNQSSLSPTAPTWKPVHADGRLPSAQHSSNQQQQQQHHPRPGDGRFLLVARSALANRSPRHPDRHAKLHSSAEQARAQADSHGHYHAPEHLSRAQLYRQPQPRQIPADQGENGGSQQPGKQQHQHSHRSHPNRTPQHQQHQQHQHRYQQQQSNQEPQAPQHAEQQQHPQQQQPSTRQWHPQEQHRQGARQLDLDQPTVYQQDVSMQPNPAAADASAKPTRRQQQQWQQPGKRPPSNRQAYVRSQQQQQQQQQPEQQLQHITQHEREDAVPEDFTCIICCEHSRALTVSPCGHNQVCARCTLRLRMCYNDIRCSLCKQPNAEVVVTRLPAKGGASLSFQDLAADRSHLWAKPQWARGVLVHDVGGPRRRGKPLHVELLQMTARACKECNAHGPPFFHSNKQLQDHLLREHSKQLCKICLKDGHKFVLELDPMSDTELAAHMDSHPRCDFCAQHFYSNDELYSHMTQQHFVCHLCQRAGRSHLYFADGPALLAHLSQEHYMCEECDPEMMAAYATEEELRQHYLQRHSRTMPRWNQARARPLLLDISYSPIHAAERGGGSSGSSSTSRAAVRQGLSAASQLPAGQQQGSSVRPGRQGRGQQQQRLEPGNGDAAAAAAEAAAVPDVRGLADAHETEGGLAIIDDDLGMSGHAQRGTPLLAGAWARRDAGSARRDDFPTLQAAVALSGGSVPASANGGPAAQHPAGPVLRKVTASCPCGRKVAHLALTEDEQVPSIPCDRECAIQRRKHQLADAFGVEDVDTHVSYFDRHRTPIYSATQLQAAIEHPEVVAAVEKEFEMFLLDKAQKRRSMQPMTTAQRQIVHELAPQYGLVTHASGNEPIRFIQLYKTPESGVPTKLLSEAAALTNREELQQQLMSAGQEGLSLRLVDISPGVHLGYYLREWAGDYTINWTGSTTATVTFSRPASFRTCSDTLAGGVRGQFRVDRTAKPALPQRTTAAEILSRPPPAAAAAAAGGSRIATAAPAQPQAPFEGWLVVSKKSGSKKAGAGGSSTAAVPAAAYVDPWSDETVGGGGAGASSTAQVPVPDDWEQDTSQSIKHAALSGQPGAQLDQSNMWEALDAISEQLNRIADENADGSASC